LQQTEILENRIVILQARIDELREFIRTDLLKGVEIMDWRIILLKEIIVPAVVEILAEHAGKGDKDKVLSAVDFAKDPDGAAKKIIESPKAKRGAIDGVKGTLRWLIGQIS